MEILYLLIPIALVFVVLAIRLFFWAVKSGQYDDLDTEGRRILFDEPTIDAAPPAKSAADQAHADQLAPRDVTDPERP